MILILTDKTSTELVYGIISHDPETADPRRALALNRARWSIESSSHYVIDWNWDGDRPTIRAGFGPENVTACAASPSA